MDWDDMPPEQNEDVMPSLVFLGGLAMGIIVLIYFTATGGSVLRGAILMVCVWALGVILGVMSSPPKD